MLKQRIATALVLLAVLLPALFAQRTEPFALLLLAMIGAAGWEWGRLNGLTAVGAGAVAVVLLGGAALAHAIGWSQAAPSALWWLAMGVWVLGGTWVLSRGVARWPALPVTMRLALGALVFWLAWLAMVESKRRGVNFLLSVFALVWAADIAAYFGGRAFGRRKLAPSISPGKSWEGVWSGMVGVLLLGAAWIAFDRGTGQTVPSLFSVLAGRLGIGGLVVALVFLAALSVVGDLCESLVKRSVGAKDSSGLLPGHGGVLDRVDALLPAFPLALALCSV